MVVVAAATVIWVARGACFARFDAAGNVAAIINRIAQALVLRIAAIARLADFGNAVSTGIALGREAAPLVPDDFAHAIAPLFGKIRMNIAEHTKTKENVGKRHPRKPFRQLLTY